MGEETLDYYEQNSQAYFDETVHVEFGETHRKFTAFLKPGASILDFGCGSGRDTLAFLKQGYTVVATDGSEQLCGLASHLTGQSVRHLLFNDLDYIQRFDGIWACSSILHLPKEELTDAFRKMAQALKAGGVVYTSFKYGVFEGIRNGRWFTDMTWESFSAFNERAGVFSVADHWLSCDVRPKRGNEQWLNLLLAKQ